MLKTRLGMQESLEKICFICLVFNMVLFMSPEMMLTMTIMLSKIQYTKNMFQILMGSIRMSKHGGIKLLAAT
jgi:hypothetical protein